jgi:tripartite-type tricarboxylate transporter receptor subunit TctC
VTRYPHLPDVPTFKELGYNVEMIIWFGMLAPKGTPKEVIDRLYAAQKKAFDENKLQPIIEKIGMIPFLTSPQEMDKIVQENHERFTRIAKEANLEVK